MKAGWIEMRVAVVVLALLVVSACAASAAPTSSADADVSLTVEAYVGFGGAGGGGGGISVQNGSVGVVYTGTGTQAISTQPAGFTVTTNCPASLSGALSTQSGDTGFPSGVTVVPVIEIEDSAGNPLPGSDVAAGTWTVVIELSNVTGLTATTPAGDYTATYTLTVTPEQ